MVFCKPEFRANCEEVIIKAFDKAVELVIETPFRLNSLNQKTCLIYEKLIDDLPHFMQVTVRFAKFVFTK